MRSRRAPTQAAKLTAHARPTPRPAPSPQVMEKVEGNRVLEHTLMRNTVLDGDNYVLHVRSHAAARRRV